MNHIGVGVNPAGGPVGGTSNAAGNVPAGARPDSNADTMKRFNTYVYDYFLKNGLYDCARALLQSDVGLDLSKASPGQRRDADGNLLNDDGGMDTDIKDEMDAKRPDDLPVANVPGVLTVNCFLYDWFCVFWDVFAAQRNLKPVPNGAAAQYLQHTQVRDMHMSKDRSIS